MKAQRNDPCPCGSGLKYKHCCESAKSPMATSRWMTVLIGVIMVVGALIAIRAFSTADQSAGGFGPPDGPAPPGKVWSYEHGHWHDAP